MKVGIGVYRISWWPLCTPPESLVWGNFELLRKYKYVVGFLPNKRKTPQKVIRLSTRIGKAHMDVVQATLFWNEYICRLQFSHFLENVCVVGINTLLDM